MARAEQEADVLLFDGGNNDQPMIAPDANVVVVDPHRPGHETSYYPGLVNLLTADVVVVNKCDSAGLADIEAVERTVRDRRPGVPIVRARSELRGPADAVAGKRCVVVGDGPTLTHGGMAFGAGSLFVQQHGGELVDPRPYFQGALAATLARYPHIDREIPAMGYGDAQIRDLEATINATPGDVVVDGTPADLARLVRLDKPIVAVDYELDAGSVELLAAALAQKGLV